MKHKYYASGDRLFYTDHGDYLYYWLEDFLKTNEWKDSYTQKQAKSVITTICLIEDIYVDTAVWDRMMWDLFWDCGISNQIEVNEGEINNDDEETREIVAFDKFENEMCEFLV